MSGFPKSDVTQENYLRETSQVDAIEKSGRRHNVRVFGKTEVSGENVYHNVVIVADKAVVAFSKEDISVCHKQPTGKLGSKTIIAKLLRRQTKHNIRANKKIGWDSRKDIHE